MTAGKLRLREASGGDCRMLWDWANEPDTRAASFSSERIGWEEHRRWFRGKLDDPLALIFIGLDPDDEPVGQVRFDMTDDSRAVISVSVAKARRRRGLGVRLVAAGVERVFRLTDAVRIDALIRPANAASIRAFETAGFTRRATTVVNGQDALRYSMTRPR